MLTGKWWSWATECWNIKDRHSVSPAARDPVMQMSLYGSRSLRRKGSSTGTGWRTESGTNAETSTPTGRLARLQVFAFLSVTVHFSSSAHSQSQCELTWWKGSEKWNDATSASRSPLGAYFKHMFLFHCVALSFCLQSFFLRSPHVTAFLNTRP